MGSTARLGRRRCAVPDMVPKGSHVLRLAESAGRQLEAYMHHGAAGRQGRGGETWSPGDHQVAAGKATAWFMSVVGQTPDMCQMPAGWCICLQKMIPH